MAGYKHLASPHVPSSCLPSPQIIVNHLLFLDEANTASTFSSTINYLFIQQSFNLIFPMYQGHKYGRSVSDFKKPPV